MARLRIYYLQQLKMDLDLEAKERWVFGREDSCDIALTEEVGVSRRHLELVKENGRWRAIRLTNKPLLFWQGTPVDELWLEPGMRFSIPSYEFEFLGEGQAATEADRGVDSGDGSEKTQVGVLPSLPTLVLYDETGNVSKNIPLSGNHWIVGRDPSCSVSIDHHKLSRKHFEILRKEGRYFIRDLGSSNGTFVKGEPVPSEDWRPLYSGDEISVYDLKMRFVLRDASFDMRSREAERALAPYMGDGPSAESGKTQINNPGGQSWSGAGASPEAQAFEQEFSPEDLGAQAPKTTKEKIREFFKKPIRAVLLLLLLLLAIFYLVMEDNQSESASQRKTSEIQTPFDKLSEEQKTLVKQLYESAQSFMQQGKYQLAKDEIAKLHQIIPYYEDSKQLEEAANQALFLLAERERQEAEAREQERIAEEIKTTIAKCRKLLGPKVTRAEVDECLSPILAYDPDHPEIKSLLDEVAKIEEERLIQEAKAREYQEKVKELTALYNKAKDLETTEQWLEAIEAYREVIQSELPDPKGLKKQSATSKESIEQRLAQRQKDIESRAQQLYQQGKWKEAIALIREAIVINPKNQVLIGIHEEWMNELRKNMMQIYQEANFEESIGDIDSAKQKWGQIRERSLPGEDYYEKSKVKLKRYGAW
jgi:pSer/pThr/pTyr-binding forkhead associated (FHA) protein/tetratricopeptide (TPR) repeat protein